MVEFTGAAALKTACGSLGGVAILLPCLLPVWLYIMTPLHAKLVVDAGPRRAMLAIVFLNFLFIHVLTALFTVPAVVGIRYGKIQVQKVATLRQVARDMPLVAFNFILSVAATYLLAVSVTEETVLQNISLHLPTTQQLMFQGPVFMMGYDIIFFHAHKAFHENKTLYARIHKIHHTWPAPVALTASFAHPVEHVVANLCSSLCGCFLCSAHPAVMLTWCVLFWTGSAGHHSGYWSDDDGMHDLHHEKFEVNYGGTGIFDYLYGTGRLHAPRREKAEKQEKTAAEMKRIFSKEMKLSDAGRSRQH